MALKYVVDTVEGLAAEVAGLYEKTEDGKFRLDVEGVVPRDKLEEFRNNNIELSKKLDTFKGIDPAKYSTLLGLEKKVTDHQLIEAGKIDEVVQTRIQGMTEEHKGVVNTLSQQLQQANGQLENLLVDSAVRVKALEAGVLPSAVDDVMLRAKSSFKIVDGKAVPHHDGKPVYGKDGVNPMGVEEWMSNLAKSATHLFGQSSGGGAGTGRPGSRQHAGTKLSAVQKISAGLSSK